MWRHFSLTREPQHEIQQLAVFATESLQDDERDLMNLQPRYRTQNMIYQGILKTPMKINTVAAPMHQTCPKSGGQMSEGAKGTGVRCSCYKCRQKRCSLQLPVESGRMERIDRHIVFECCSPVCYKTLLDNADLYLAYKQMGKCCIISTRWRGQKKEEIIAHLDQSKAEDNCISAQVLKELESNLMERRRRGVKTSRER